MASVDPMAFMRCICLAGGGRYRVAPSPLVLTTDHTDRTDTERLRAGRRPALGQPRFARRNRCVSGPFGASRHPAI